MAAILRPLFKPFTVRKFLVVSVLTLGLTQAQGLAQGQGAGQETGQDAESCCTSQAAAPNLVKLWEEAAAVPELACEDDRPHPFELHGFDDNTPQFKPDVQLFDYFQCYQKPHNESPFEKYGCNYRYVLQLTSAQFRIPYAMLSCMLFRESDHWTGRRSPTGAKGLGQLTSIFLEDYNKVKVKNSQRFSSELQHSIDRLNLASEEQTKGTQLLRNESDKDDADAQRLINDAKRNRDYVNKVLMVSQQKNLKYFRLMNQLKAMRDDLEANIYDCVPYYTRATCNKVQAVRKRQQEFPFNINRLTRKDLKNPQANLILASFHLKWLKVLITDNWQDEILPKGDNDQQTQNLKERLEWYLSTVAYNMGFDSLETVLNGAGYLGQHGKPIKSVQDIERALHLCRHFNKSKCSQAYNHITSIENCSEFNSYRPMSGDDGLANTCEQTLKQRWGL